MANTFVGSVLVVDTTGAIPGNFIIKSITHDSGGASSAFTIKKTNTSGTIMFDAAVSATDVFFSDVDIVANNGIYVTIAGSAKAYLHLK